MFSLFLTTALLNKKKPVPQNLSCAAPAIHGEAGNRGATMVNDMTVGRKKDVCSMNEAFISKNMIMPGASSVLRYEKQNVISCNFPPPLVNQKCQG